MKTIFFRSLRFVHRICTSVAHTCLFFLLFYWLFGEPLLLLLLLFGVVVVIARLANATNILVQLKSMRRTSAAAEAAEA